MTHLWEIKHPYYCEEGHFFGTGGERDVNTHFKTWADFYDARKDCDPDYNLVFRWDWDEQDINEKSTFNGDAYYRNGTLSIFWFVQRKGFHQVTTVDVCRADEPAVIEFLTPKWEHMRRLWEGLSGWEEPA